MGLCNSTEVERPFSDGPEGRAFDGNRRKHGPPAVAKRFVCDSAVERPDLLAGRS